MSFVIEVDHAGTASGAKLKIERIEHNATHMRDVFWGIYFYIVAENEKQFDTRGRGTWPPLDDDTIFSKRTHREDPRPMVASGRLKASLAGLASPDRIIHVDEDSLYFASLVPYGPIHDRGSKEKNIPVRKPMDITRGKRSYITRLIRTGVLGAD